MSGDLLPIALRAHAVPARPDGNSPRGRRVYSPRPRRVDAARRPESILVFDCETMTGPEQALLFGCYRYYRLRWRSSGPRLVCITEGLFYGDDLPDRDPAGFELLSQFGRWQSAAVTVRDVD